MPQGNLVAYPVTDEFTESMEMSQAHALIDLTRETIHESTCTPPAHTHTHTLPYCRPAPRAPRPAPRAPPPARA